MGYVRVTVTDVINVHIVGLQVRLASVRRSLFSGEAERAKFLNHLARGTRELLRSQQGLAEHANYHEFCRLLGRLKTNYQLSELVRHRCTSPLWIHGPAAAACAPRCAPKRHP